MTIPKNEQSFQTNNYVEPTFLARYPLDGYPRGLGFAMRESFIYTIIGYNPTIIDVTTPSEPTFVAEYVVEDGRMNTLALRDSYLYLGSNDGLEILDISNLTNIIKVGQYNTTIQGVLGGVNAITLQGDCAYLATQANGLVIVNISNPMNPVEVGCFNDGGSAWDLALEGSLAFLADTETSLEILDVSDPSNPMKVSHFEDPVYGNLSGYSVTLNGSYAYLGTNYHGLFILDITDSSHPVRIGHFYGDTKYPIGDEESYEIVRGTFVHEQYVFEAAGRNGLYILDATTPSKPLLVGQYTSCYFTIGTFLHETYLYLQDLFLGILILNLTYYSSKPFQFPVELTIVLGITGALGVIIALPLLYMKRKKKKEEKLLAAVIAENR